MTVLESIFEEIYLIFEELLNFKEIYLILKRYTKFWSDLPVFDEI